MSEPSQALGKGLWMQPVRTGEQGRLSENSSTRGSGSLKGGAWGPGSTSRQCFLITGLLGARVCGSQIPVRHTGWCGGSVRSLCTERMLELEVWGAFACHRLEGIQMEAPQPLQGHIHILVLSDAACV